jgi:hypothetical protein
MQLEINQGFRENAADSKAPGVTSAMGCNDQINHRTQS